MRARGSPRPAPSAASVLRAFLTIVVLLAHTRARADTLPRPGVRADGWADTITLAAAIATTLTLPAVLPVHPTRWRQEVLSVDEPFRGVFSPTDSTVSDVTLLTTLAVPVIAEASFPHARSDEGDKAVVYAEALAVTTALNTVDKYLVARPRPYVYSDDPAAVARARAAGDDAYLSFFSGHAATSFTAAVAGSLLFSYDEPSRAARALMWGSEMALATTTAALRVRAGKHFPSDVLFGALVGSVTGLLVVRAHTSDRDAYSPSAVEWAAMGGGVVLGTALCLVLPEPPEHATEQGMFVLAPWTLRGGAGIAMQGTY